MTWAEMPLAVLIDRDGIVREVFEAYRRGREKNIWSACARCCANRTIGVSL